MSTPIASWTKTGKNGRAMCTVEVYPAGSEPTGYHVERSDDGAMVMVWRFVNSPPIEPKPPTPGRPREGRHARPRPVAAGPVPLPPPGADLTAWRRARRVERRLAVAAGGPMP